MIVGLGNPGPQFFNTRHNAGFMVLDSFREEHGLSYYSHRDAEVAPGKLAGREFVLVKPATFMNRSGLAVAWAAGEFGVDPDEILVVHDDLDLPVGRMRFKSGGGDGGHRGLRSIISAIGTPEFGRLKIGIGRPEEEGADAVDYVLERFSPGDEERIAAVIEASGDALTEWIRSGIARCMNLYNGRVFGADE